MPAHTLSPLRYPGGKSAIAPYLNRFISTNGLEKCAYAEPYAGGAGAALKLLSDNVVSDIYLNDIDNHIYAVWYSILHRTKQFLDLIINTPITIAEWDYQREVYKNASKSDISLDVAFSTFFLNRCNRSGVITGGVIGGLNQAGQYKMDARFNKPKLIQKIQWISSKKKHIHISKYDALMFLDEFYKNPNKDKFIYLDPPYYNQGPSLYFNSYQHNDHVALRDKLHEIAKGKWLLSYDDTPEIKSIYGNKIFESKKNAIHYSLRRVRDCSEIIIKSPACVWPKDF